MARRFLHSGFGADVHQKLAVTAKVFRAQRCYAIKVGDITKHLTPLAGQQVNDVDPFRLPFQQRGGGAEKVNVGIRRHPALGAPVQDAFQCQRYRLCFRRNCQDRTQRLNLTTLGHLDKHFAQRQVDLTLTVNIGILVMLVDKFPIVIFKPIGVDLAVVAVR